MRNIHGNRNWCRCLSDIYAAPTCIAGWPAPRRYRFCTEPQISRTVLQLEENHPLWENGPADADLASAVERRASRSRTASIPLRGIGYPRNNVLISK